MRWRERSEGSDRPPQPEGLLHSHALHSALRSPSPESLHAYSYTPGMFYLFVYSFEDHTSPKTQSKVRKIFYPPALALHVEAMGHGRKGRLTTVGREKYRQRGWLIQLHVLWMDEQLQAKCVGVMLGREDWKEEEKKVQSHSKR